MLYWPPTTFSGSDYFWILRLWTDKEGLVRKGAQGAVRSASRPLRMGEINEYPLKAAI